MATPIRATNNATKLKPIDAVLLSLLLDDEGPPALSKFLYGSGELAILCELPLSIVVKELTFNPATFWLLYDIQGLKPSVRVVAVCYVCMIFL